VVNVVAGDGEVTVVVMMHWNSDSEHGEPHTEPMAQQAAFVPFAGSAMQYVSSGQQKPTPTAPMSLPVWMSVSARVLNPAVGRDV
jgi:hypothetical protein